MQSQVLPNGIGSINQFPSIFTNVAANAKPQYYPEGLNEDIIDYQGGIVIYGELIIHKESSVLKPH